MRRLWGRRVRRRAALLAAVGAIATFASDPAPASALNPIKPVCSGLSLVSGLAGKACKVAQNAGKVVSAGKQLSKGRVGKALGTVLGAGGSAVASHATTAIGLAAIGAWVLGGAKFALHETGKVLSETTTPQLRSTWFSSAYWRMAGIAALLTLPFLFAAAIQALIRSDLALLARAAFGYLPLAMLAVGIAAPLTMLLLVVSDQLSAVVSSAAGHASAHFLDFASGVVGVLTIFSGSPFLAFLVGIFTATAALVLWLELLVRDAAVYVIVLMLPLAFAALVWPARRVWAIRAVELLVALILSKFAIVAVLSLGGAAVSNSVGGHSITGAVAGGTLVLMAAFAPWALLRLLPLAELASGAAGSLRAESGAGKDVYAHAQTAESRVGNWLASMRNEAEQAGAAGDRGEPLSSSAEPPSSSAEPPSSSVESQPSPLVAAESSPSQDAQASPASTLGEKSANGAAFSASTPVREPGPSEHGERSPGMDPLWQAGDFEWRPLPLGFEGGGPPELWPNGAAPGAGGDPGAAGDGATPAPSTSAPNPADDHEPRPAEQPPTEGRL